MASTVSQNVPVSQRATEVGVIIGPLLVENCFNWVLLGVLTVQVYVYCIAFPRDRWAIKSLVYATYLLEALQSLILLVNDVQSFTKGIENADALFTANTLWTVAILTGLVTFLCQGLFTYRIWVLAEHRPVLKIEFYCIAICCLTQLICSLMQGFSAKNIAPLDIGQAKVPFKVVSALWCASAALGDVFIAICMVHLLFQIQDNPYNPTRRILQKIVHLTVGTGSLTALISVITLILVFSSSNPGYYEICLATLGKIYSNSMMVLLNNRIQLLPPGSNSLDWTPTRNEVQNELETLSRLRFAQSGNSIG